MVALCSRLGCRSMELFYQVISTELGDCFCCADSTFLIYLNFVDSKHSVDECIASVGRLYPDCKLKQGDVAFKKEVHPSYYHAKQYLRLFLHALERSV